MADDWKNIPTLVPEIYYDLIARFPAGCMLVAGLVLLSVENNRCGTCEKLATLNSTIALTGVVVIYVFLAYAVGLVLSSCGTLINNVYWFHTFRNVASKYPYCLPKVLELFHIKVGGSTLLSREGCHLLYRRSQDYLKRNDPEARVVLPKMQAEAGLFTSLSCAVVFEFLAYLVVEHHSASLQTWAVAAGLFDGSWLCAWYRTKRLLERQFSYLALKVPNSSPEANGQPGVIDPSRWFLSR